MRTASESEQAESNASALPGRKSTGRQLLRLGGRLLLAVLALALAAGLASLALQLPYAGLAGLQARIWPLKLTGVALQLLAVAVAYWRWPSLVNWAVRRGLIQERERAAALAVRVKAALLALAIVLTASIGSGDLTRLYRLLFS